MYNSGCSGLAKFQGCRIPVVKRLSKLQLFSKHIGTHVSAHVHTPMHMPAGTLYCPTKFEALYHIGHNFIGDNQIGHTHTGRNYIGHDYMPARMSRCPTSWLRLGALHRQAHCQQRARHPNYLRAALIPQAQTGSAAMAEHQTSGSREKRCRASGPTSTMRQ